MPLTLDPEFAKVLEPLLPALASRPKPPVGDIATRRAGVDGLWAALMEGWDEVTDVEETVHHVKTEDGFDLSIYQYTKSGTSSSAPSSAAIYLHGGGYFCLSVPLYSKTIRTYVSMSGVPIFAPEYRSAPEHPYPTPLEDSFTALLHVVQNAGTLNIDPTRIAIMGDSAGGGLAAGVALLARDRHLSPPPSHQILINAMLDDRNMTPHPSLAPYATWSTEDNITGWQAYAGRKAARCPVSYEISPYAAPARIESVKGLPTTYIDVPQLDIFRAENIKYARRLMEEDIDVELHVYPGLPHAFDSFAPKISQGKRAIGNRVRFLQTI